MTVSRYAGRSVVDEFKGQDHVTFNNAGTAFNFANKSPGAYGQAKLGGTLLLGKGLTAFAEGHADFGGDLHGAGGQIGLRWRW